MTIKHLVISGGGVMGYRYLSILQYLNEQQVWQIENIQTIYATSIGTFIGVCVALKYDWQTLETYMIDRPWNDVFQITGKQIFETYTNKGIYTMKISEMALKPLLLAKSLDLHITLKDFYEYTQIEMHFMTLNLNKFETIDISYKTHPNLTLIQTIYMSCAVPGIFSPICEEINGETCCYVDGGVLDNYPTNKCIKNNANPDEILGIKLVNKSSSIRNIVVSRETNILDFFLAFFTNSVYYIRDKIELIPIKNEVCCYIKGDEFSIDYIKNVVNDKETRRQLFNQGIEDAIEFLSCLKNENNEPKETKEIKETNEDNEIKV
jgi:predicted acylesterase/phospholipase RssA